MTCRSWCTRSLTCKYRTESQGEKKLLLTCPVRKLSCSQGVFWHFNFRYQRSTTAISVGKFILAPFFVCCVKLLLPASVGIWFLVCLPAVAPICYAHLAAAQVGQFIKFDEMSETSSSHGGHTSAGSVPVQELPRLHEKVRSSMFFC